jgi:hypothetical protein
MNMKSALTLVLLIATLTACGASKDAGETAAPTTSTTSAAETQTATTASTAQQYIEMEGYRFKLEPDVQKDGTAHLDFYVRDLADKHVKGVTGTFIITKPDGTKTDILVEEETPHDHYHGMLKLDQVGEYLIVAQVTVADKKANPRFSFTRK